MQSGTAMHGQAASALSETRSKYILNPSKRPGLGKGLREAKQRSVLLQPMCAAPNRGLFASADVREPNRGLFGLNPYGF